MQINWFSMVGRRVSESEVVYTLKSKSKGYIFIDHRHITKLLDETSYKEENRAWHIHDVATEYELNYIKIAIEKYLDIDTIKSYFKDYRKTLKNINTVKQNIRNYIINKESKIKLNIRNSLSRLRTLFEKLRMLYENQDIRNHRRKHGEEGISGFTNRIFEGVRNESLKYFSDKEIFKLMNIKAEELLDEITKRFKSEYVMYKIGQKFQSLNNFLRQLTG